MTGLFYTKSFLIYFIKGGVPTIEVLCIGIVLCDSDCFTETLIVCQFPLPQELNGIANIRVINQTQNIIIGNPRFLLCCNFVKTTGLKNPVFMRVCSIANFRWLQPCKYNISDREKISGTRRTAKKQGEGIENYVEPLLRSNAVTERIFDGMIRNSSGFQWARRWFWGFSCLRKCSQPKSRPSHDSGV